MRCRHRVPSLDHSLLVGKGHISFLPHAHSECPQHYMRLQNCYTAQTSEAQVPGRPPLPCPFLLPSPGQLPGLQSLQRGCHKGVRRVQRATRTGCHPLHALAPWGAFSDPGSVLSDPVTPAILLASVSPGTNAAGVHRVAWIWRAAGRRGAPRGVRASPGAAAAAGPGAGPGRGQRGPRRPGRSGRRSRRSASRSHVRGSAAKFLACGGGGGGRPGVRPDREPRSDAYGRPGGAERGCAQMRRPPRGL